MPEKHEILIQAMQFRKSVGEDESSPMDIFRIALKVDDLTIVHYPLGENISGICIKSPKSNVIAINSKNTLGRQNFTLAHELYHLYFDETNTSICTITPSTPLERAADQFASYLLLPPAAIKQEYDNYVRKHGKFTVDGVIYLEQLYGVSRQAMLICLQDIKVLSSADADKMKSGVIAKASALGYDIALYRPLPDEKQYMTHGAYIKNVNTLLEKEKISDGKYEELLMNAFRSDLVYGDEEVDIID